MIYNYMAQKINLENLAELKMQHSNQKIGVSFSCWDLLHAGHQLFLSDSKSKCDILCVGLQTDPTIDRPEKINQSKVLKKERYN